MSTANGVQSPDRLTMMQECESLRPSIKEWHKVTAEIAEISDDIKTRVAAAKERVKALRDDRLVHETTIIDTLVKYNLEMYSFGRVDEGIRLIVTEKELPITMDIIRECLSSVISDADAVERGAASVEAALKTGRDKGVTLNIDTIFFVSVKGVVKAAGKTESDIDRVIAKYKELRPRRIKYSLRPVGVRARRAQT